MPTLRAKKWGGGVWPPLTPVCDTYATQTLMELCAQTDVTVMNIGGGQSVVKVAHGGVKLTAVYTVVWIPKGSAPPKYYTFVY